MRVLVTGAGGYIGSRLVGALLADGHEVRAALTDPSRAARFWWHDRVEVVQLDVRDPARVRAAVDGMAAVYYLVHSMSGGEFIRTDRTAAHRMATACADAGVQRIVYLSGLVPAVPADQLSDHLSSRAEVEQIFTASGVPALTLRCAIIVGSGSTSFEIVRQISHRLPVHPIPGWMDSLVQPVAVVDVLAVLVACLTGPNESRGYDVGGPERLTYGALLARFCDVAGIRRLQVPLPVVDEDLAGSLAGILTDVPGPLVRELVHSLRHDMVAREDDFRGALIPADAPLTSLAEAIERSLTPPDEAVPPDRRDPQAALPGDPPWSGGNAWPMAERLESLRADTVGQARRAARRTGASLGEFASPGGMAAAAGWLPSRALALGFAATARFRHGRALHYLGVAGTGTLELIGGQTGVSVLDTPASLAVHVRWSRAAGLSWDGPDVEGMALRLPLGPDNPGRRPFADLLFASTGSGDVGRYTLQPRSAGSYGALSTLVPVRTPRGQLILRLTPAEPGRTGDPAGPAAASDDLPPTAYELSWSGLRGAWTRLGRLQISWSDGDTDERFDPITHPLPGTRQHPLVTMLRRPSYRSSRDQTPRT